MRRQAALGRPVVGHHANAVETELGLQLDVLVVDVLELAARDAARLLGKRCRRRRRGLLVVSGEVELPLEALKSGGKSFQTPFHSFTWSRSRSSAYLSSWFERKGALADFSI